MFLRPQIESTTNIFCTHVMISVALNGHYTCDIAADTLLNSKA